MPEVSNLGIVLAQTKMVERLQEANRRQGEIAQQQLTRELADKVDIQGRQVDKTTDAQEARVDPDARKEEESETGESEARSEDERDPAKPGSEDSLDRVAEDEGKGHAIDVKA